MIRSLSDNTKSIWGIIRDIHNANVNPKIVLHPGQLDHVGLSRGSYNASMKEALDRQLMAHCDRAKRRTSPQDPRQTPPQPRYNRSQQPDEHLPRQVSQKPLTDISQFVMD